MGQSPEGKTMMESYGNWNFAYYYIDENANPGQRKALEAIAGAMLTPGVSKKRRRATRRSLEGSRAKSIKSRLGNTAASWAPGRRRMGGAPKIVNPPGADPLHHQYEQGRTTKMTYSDADQNWSWSDSNYMLGTFSVDNIQYEKFAAGLAQKMAGMKKRVIVREEIRSAG